jgi:hypothetical protein
MEDKKYYISTKETPTSHKENVPPRWLLAKLKYVCVLIYPYGNNIEASPHSSCDILELFTLEM